MGTTVDPSSFCIHGTRGETEPPVADAVVKVDVVVVGIRGVEEREGPLAPAPDGPPLPEGTIPVGAGQSDRGKGDVGEGGTGCKEEGGVEGVVGLSGGW